MYFVYIDDSGDTGLPTGTNPQQTIAYTLSAVLIRDVDWLSTLNEISKFRGFLQKNFGIKHSAELKANYLIHSKGPLAYLKLSDEARMKIYKMALKLQVNMKTVITWAVVIDKVRWAKKGYRLSVMDAAWQNMVERLERFTAEKQEPCMVFPDNGNDKYVRGIFRRMRRFSRPNSMFSGSGMLERNAELIMEDPSFRRSNDSYFIQLADLNAYAAYRHVFPGKWFGAEYWDYLGDCRYEKVNKWAGGPRGIVLKP